MTSACLECGAVLPEGKTCRQLLDQIIVWDFEDYMGVGKIHLLTVMCYNLQHPSLYSREGLDFGIDTLLTVMRGEGVDAVRAARGTRAINIGNAQDFTLTATPDNIASYTTKPVWTMTTDTILAGGASGYPERVRDWATSMYTALLASGNIV